MVVKTPKFKGFKKGVSGGSFNNFVGNKEIVPLFKGVSLYCGVFLCRFYIFILYRVVYCLFVLLWCYLFIFFLWCYYLFFLLLLCFVTIVCIIFL